MMKKPKWWNQVFDDAEWEALEAEEREQRAKKEAQEAIREQIRLLVKDKRNSMWTRIGSFDDVGLLADGSLFNPHGYPEAEVRAAVKAAKERAHQRRSKAAKEAAVTRARRHEKLVLEMARRITSVGGIPINMNAIHCQLCGKHLSDPESISRGVGSECWQGVMAMAEHIMRS